MDAGATAATARPQEKLTMKKTSTSTTPAAISCTIEHVTPEIATEWLKKNVGNRPLNLAMVKRLSRALAAGEYVFTHQGVAFDTNGMLIDGQHRLHAITESGVAIDLVVTRGLATKAREKIDTGARRTVAHVLSFRFGLTGTEAKAASAVIHSVCALNGQPRSGLRESELCSIFEQYRRGIVWAMAYYPIGHRIGVPTPILASLVWAYEHATKSCEYIAEKFLRPTRLEEGSPILALQTAARTNASHDYENRRALALKSLRALEAILDKKPLARLDATPAVIDRLVDRFSQGTM